MSREIRNKVAIITGASMGIGRETALLRGRGGAQVVLVAWRDSLLREIQGEIEKTGSTALCLALDLTERENVSRMITAAHERFGRIDILINNAAFGFFGTV